MHTPEALPDRTIRSNILLAGRLTAGGDGPIDAVDPARGVVIGIVDKASEGQIAEAIALGRQAMWHPSWSAALAQDRSTVLHRIAALIDHNCERLAALQTMQNGKPITDSRKQARAAAAAFRYYAGLCETLESGMPPARGSYLGMTLHEPVGVVAAITPWNSPLTMAAQKIAPALAAGNAVVLKPAEQSAFVTVELGRLCHEAGLPSGLLSVLPGSAETGKALVSSQGVDLISFTGGTKTGRAIASAAGQRLIPALLELGGKSPHIVFPDADLDKAADAVVMGIFNGAGQSCVAGSRLFIHTSIAEAFKQRLLELTSRLIIGSPTSDDTQIGPLVSKQHRALVEGYVELAVAEGGQILAGGSRPSGSEYEAGSYFLPTIIDGLDNQARSVREEIFGPVLSVLTFHDEDDLVEQANDNEYGLACGIWTGDYRRAWRLARAINAGTVWINSYKILSIANPFGGFRDSGLGREKGIEGLRSYQLSKSVLFGI